MSEVMVRRMHEGFKTLGRNLSDSQTFVEYELCNCTREILCSNFSVRLIQKCKPQKMGFLNCRKLMPDNPSKTLQTSNMYRHLLLVNNGALNIRYL